MAVPSYRNPRADASSHLPPGHEARVLEPSPPANPDPNWFADDPTDPAGATAPLVTPIPGEGTTWDELADGNARLSDYASSHWLSTYRRLGTLPESHDTVRLSLHQLAFFAIAPKRHTVNQKIGLRYTHGGFGTPFFDEDEQVRVEGTLLVRQLGKAISYQSVTTLAAACDFLEVPYRDVWFDNFHDPPSPIGPDTKLTVTEAAAKAIGDWFGFGASVLEQVRRTPEAREVSRVQLWPEHFDLAIEMGSSSQRASYGASPGDDNHPEPYLYVSAWEPVDRSDRFWNDSAFNGASLSYRTLLDADDQRAIAFEFFDLGYRTLTA